MKPSEFWQLTERELSNYVKGYRNRQAEEWRRTRLIAYIDYKMNTGKGSVSIEEFMPLDGDTIKKTRTPNRRKIKELNNKANKIWEWQT